VTRRRRRKRGRIGEAAVGLCGLGLAGSLVSLSLTGPPPAVRVDALWVNAHRLEVWSCLASIGLAIAGTTLAFAARRCRLPATGLWLVAGAAAFGLFSDRLPLIVRVLLEHSF
jgi:hypothetical protein